MRRLGRSSLEVAPLALGGNVFGWTADRRASFALLDVFVDRGFNLIDTADVYSRWAPGHVGGESESIIGDWLKSRGHRARVVIATKVGAETATDKPCLSKNYILRAVERSLERLQTDYIDLYQAHIDDPTTSQEETLEAFALLIREGKARATGASNFTAPRLASALYLSSALGLPAFVCLQPEYNLYERAGFERELAALCLKEELGVIAHSSLASGFLTGKYRTESDVGYGARSAKVRALLNPRGYRILAALDVAANEIAATPAQVALAWLMQRVTAPIVSATSVPQLEELLVATEIALPTDTLGRLTSSSES
jgi:aryl-alcohol dehydrogenase-like predicted oxidoreductase